MNQVTTSESTIELPRHIAQEPSIERIIEIYTTDDPSRAPHARIILAQNQTGDHSYQTQRSSCHYLLQRLLCSVSPDQDQCWQLNYAASGAPRLAFVESDHLKISMAHSADWMVAGVANQSGIGVDIERIKPRNHISRKTEFLNWNVPVHDNQDFHAKWTLWEASAKCVEGSVLMRENPGFEELCRLDTHNRVCQTGLWSGLHGCLDEKVFYAIVLRSQNDLVMGHRVLHPEELEPWLLPGTHR